MHETPIQLLISQLSFIKNSKWRFTNETYSESKRMPYMWWKELGKGHQHSSYSVMYPSNKLSIGYDVDIICIECGLIIENYVEKPVKFKGTLWMFLTEWILPIL